MDDQRLFQLGMDLVTGATQTEDTNGSESADKTTLKQTLLDSDRHDHFIRRNGRIYAGTHLIIEVVGGKYLDSIERIERAFRRCVSECGATLLHIHLHKFSPQGVSGVAVLAESHISVHTWPEAEYGAFDVFMCGDAQPELAIAVLREEFEAREVRAKTLLRGDGIV